MALVPSCFDEDALLRHLKLLNGDLDLDLDPCFLPALLGNVEDAPGPPLGERSADRNALDGDRVDAPDLWEAKIWGSRLDQYEIGRSC